MLYVQYLIPVSILLYCKFVLCVSFTCILLVIISQLSHVNTLEGLGQLTSVTTLVLENNPLLEFHSDFASYAAGIRKYFPSLQVLVSERKCGTMLHVFNTCYCLLGWTTAT